MANKIDLVTKFIPLLDEVYQTGAKSAILEADATMVRQTEDANVVKVNKFSCDGLGDYDKQAGFANIGAITSEWETWTFTNDRGRAFNLDKMDNLENLQMAFLGMAGQFMRTKVIPEKDAYTFAKIAGAEGVTSNTESLTSANVKAAVDRDIAALEESEVDTSNIVMFITPTVKGALETAVPRQITSGVDRFNQRINYYNEIPLIAVPQRRLYDAIDLLDGKSSGETAGGYKKHVATGASGDVAGHNINYIMMDRNAAITITKNVVAKVIAPEVNQLYDGWTFQYRFYYDTFLFDNKKAGIRVSKQSS